MKPNVHTKKAKPPISAAQKSARKKALKWLIIIVGIMCLLGVGATILIRDLIGGTDTIPTLVDEHIAPFVEEHYMLSVVTLILVYTAQVVVAIIPGEIIEIAAGLMFGTVWGPLWGAIWGTLFCVIGATLGSVLVLMLSRKYGRRLVNALFPGKDPDSLPILRDPKKRNLIVFILFLIPGTPKDVLTYFVGLTNISTPYFLLVSGFGRVFAILTSALMGASVQEGQYLMLIIVAAVTAAVSLIGAYVWRRHQKQPEQVEGKEPSDGEQ